jgi:hypothetical protein
MTIECPCGCGRTIPRASKRTAERAVFVDSLAGLLESAGTGVLMAHAMSTDYQPPLVEIEPRLAHGMVQFARTGRRLSADVMSNVHREPSPSPLPSCRVLSSWEADALRMVRPAAHLDPRFARQLQHLIRNRVKEKDRHMDVPAIPATAA